MDAFVKRMHNVAVSWEEALLLNEHLFRFDMETESPTVGVLLADHFTQSYGFQGHRTRGTKDWLIIYTVSGSGSFRVEREVHTCVRGDVVILSPGIPHHYAANEGEEWEILWAHFMPLPEWSPWLDLPRTEERLICISTRKEDVRIRIERAFQRMIRDAAMPELAFQELAKLALAEVLVLLNHGVAEQKKGFEMDGRITQVLQYCSQHLNRRHRLSDLAAMAGLSESRFCHLMKEQTGDTITERLRKMRLAKAARLLEFTTLRINEIADEVGFDSAYYFSRQFSAQFGVSPTAYRRRFRQFL
ncbi:helix-turn-helix domain-containing protein [Paenibacillus antri]|uniref:Helix-turn-helix domain-containing protein n=1 Tax=Paenibacillus antri TaxID=2582848 RepID=A0A5R9GHA1_9BACL|nr:helix-turn-helix domain-containing protein [Paenibacillus antri]TLS52798.1 helix-turn-helix domain-containing protein [Paenibacillus antri]